MSIKLKNSSDFTKARDILTSEFPDIQWTGQEPVADSDKLEGTLLENTRILLEETALKQNIITLSNRINELGVAEPIVQQQGRNRIVVQLPEYRTLLRQKKYLEGLRP